MWLQDSELFESLASDRKGFLHVVLFSIKFFKATTLNYSVSIITIY